jgi:hypothetical protein
VVLAALVHALGRALRWRYADEFKANQSRVDKTVKRFATARQGRAN